MQHAKLTGLLLAACTFAASQHSFAAGDLNILHPYNCRLVSSSSPFAEIHGAFQGGHFVNTSGSAAWIVCPIDYETTNSSFNIYLSAQASGCSWLTTSAQTGTATYYGPTSQGPTGGGGYYYSWSQNLGNFASAIQCLVANGVSVWAYYSS